MLRVFIQFGQLKPKNFFLIARPLYFYRQFYSRSLYILMKFYPERENRSTPRLKKKKHLENWQLAAFFKFSKFINWHHKWQNAKNCRCRYNKRNRQLFRYNIKHVLLNLHPLTEVIQKNSSIEEKLGRESMIFKEIGFNKHK